MKRLLLLLLILLPRIVTAGEFVLIIDDLGNHKNDLQVFSFPAGVTLSFLPYTPYADKIVRMAEEQQRELMLHLPMEAHNGKKMGPAGLSVAMNEDEFRATLNQVFASYPQAKGANNHMGSKLSELEQPMTWLIDELQQRALFFIDSKTSPHSVAEKLALQNHLSTDHRDLFLDHLRTETFIRQQLQKTKRRMEKGEVPIVLAHPYPETMRLLTKLLPAMVAEGNRIIPVSEALQKKRRDKKIPQHLTESAERNRSNSDLVIQ